MATNHSALRSRRLARGETNPQHLRGKWVPSVTDARSADLIPPPTGATKSIEALAEPSGVFTPGIEPGPSEFSWGKGLMAPPGMAPPSLIDQHHAIMRTNPADPGASADYETEDVSHSASGRFIARVREEEMELGEL